MVFYAVVTDDSRRVIEFFPSRDEAELMLVCVLRDEPDWREILHVEEIDLESGAQN